MRPSSRQTCSHVSALLSASNAPIVAASCPSGDPSALSSQTFGPKPFQLNGGHGEANAAVHKAAGKDQPVTQEIAVSVKGDQVQCAINGTVVASYPKSQVVGPGKLKSTDGVYGVRFAHNTEGIVTGLTVTKP